MSPLLLLPILLYYLLPPLPLPFLFISPPPLSFFRSLLVNFLHFPLSSLTPFLSSSHSHKIYPFPFSLTTSFLSFSIPFFLFYLYPFSNYLFLYLLFYPLSQLFFLILSILFCSYSFFSVSVPHHSTLPLPLWNKV